MEFFKKINDLLGEGCTLSVNIAKKCDYLSVSVMPGNPLVKDVAVKNLTPLVISGTPEELDKGFAEAISEPVARVSGLLVDIASFEKGEAETKAKSAALAKQREEKQRKEVEFKGYLALAKENNDAHKFKDARTCLDKARIATDGSEAQIKLIKEMDSTIEKSSGIDNIFGAPEDTSDGKNVVFKASKAKSAPAPKAASEDEGDSEDEDEE